MIAQKLSIIIPIHNADIIRGPKQWYTRVLYNAYSPFNYTLMLDAHVFPCYNTSYREIFRLFKESDVDISYSNRMNIRHISAAAVLSKWGPRSFHFWMESVKVMKEKHMYDDQGSAYNLLFLRKQEGFTFKLMSSNWFFASHGISKTGEFLGSEKCYRSSIVVNGPVQWIHGDPSQCIVMNGKQDEKIHQSRVYFLCRECACNYNATMEHTTAFSKEELQEMVGNYSIPSLIWEDDGKHDSQSLFWEF